jgi:hypothetical protein
MRYRLGDPIDSQRLLEDSQGFGEIAQKERRYRTGRLQARINV